MRDHTQSAPVRHPHHDVTGAVIGEQLQRFLQHHDHRVEAFDREGLLPQEGAAQVAVHGFDLGQPAQQLELAFRAERLAIATGLDPLAQPVALFVTRDVLDLIGDRRAVGLPQVHEHLGEIFAGNADAQDAGGNRLQELGREAMVHRIERRIAGRCTAERIQPGGEVAVAAIGRHQGHAGRHRSQQLGFGRGWRGDRRLRTNRARCLADTGRCRHMHRLEGRLVEAVRARQQLVDPAQVLARFGALDDAVVVGARHRHHFGDAQLAQPAFRDGGELWRVTDGAGGHDGPLALHQPWDRRHRADAAGIGEHDGGAGEIVGDQLASAGFRHQRLVLIAERGEVQPVGVANHRHQQHAATILALHVNRQPQVNAACDPGGGAVDPFECHRHRRHVLHGMHDGEGDQMGVGNLFRPARRLDRLIELPAPLVQKVDPHAAKAGGGRYLTAFLHVLDQRGRRAP